MAETEPAPAEEAAAPAAAEETPDSGEGGEKQNGKNFKRREQPPIEELFDLSKPIPKADKPNKTEHDEKLKELTDAIDAIKTERSKVQSEIDEALSDPESKAKLQEARNELQTHKTEKNKLINEKRTMRAELDSIRNQTDKIVKDKKDARNNIKFNSLKEIEDEIARLQRKQETTTMSLNDEKRLIKEMDALQASKKYVADIKDKDAAMATVKEQRQGVAERLKSKDKEIDEVSAKIELVMKTIEGINAADSKKRESLQGLFKKREELKKTMGDKLKEKDALRDDFREKNDAFYNYQRAVRAQKKMAYEEEKRKREEEKAAYLAKLAEEEAKKIPYEEEQALCDYLADYLERTYLSTGAEKSAGEKKSDVVAVKEDPFAGMKPVSKKDDEEYFGKGKGKKSRKRTAKKQDATAGPFTLSVDTFEQFGLLNLSPPTAIGQVENSVKQLREKKEWYKQQPRGSVPTAQEIRKASEKEAAKIRQSTENGETNAPKAKKGGAFNLSSEEFAPLGGSAASSSVNSSWGQKPAAPAGAEDEPPATEEAAVAE